MNCSKLTHMQQLKPAKENSKSHVAFGKLESYFFRQRIDEKYNYSSHLREKLTKFTAISLNFRQLLSSLISSKLVSTTSFFSVPALLRRVVDSLASISTNKLSFMFAATILEKSETNLDLI